MTRRRRLVGLLGTVSLVVAVLGACGDGVGAVGVTTVDLPSVGGAEDEYETVEGAVAWRGGLVAVTSEGTVVRSDGGTRLEAVPARELAEVTGLAAGPDVLVAVGSDSGWRSRDGRRWEALQSTGLGGASLRTVVHHGGAFLAFGSDESDAELVWRSDDGERWQQVETSGLNDPARYRFQSVVSVAEGAHGLLAVQDVELADSYDDSTFGIWRSDDGRTWDELEYSGLDDLDLANTDVVPRVAAFGDGYVGVGTDEDVATLWRSTDGARWTGELRLGGTELADYAESIDAVTATDDGIVALEITQDGLVVWRVSL